VLQVLVTAFEAVEPADENLQFRKKAGQDQINRLHYIARMKAIAALDLNSPQSRRALAFLVEHGTVIDPTLALFEFMTRSTAKPPVTFELGIAKIPPELAAILADVGPPSPIADLQERRFAKFVAITGALHKAGVPIVAGTDQCVPGHSLHREIELYVQAGFTPMEAIQAATIVPARVMGLDKEVGTVEPGKRADLILVGGNPLESIHNIRNVKYVVADGKMYDCAELWRSVGFKP